MNDVAIDWTAPRPVRLRIDDFVVLDAAGVFATYAKTELIEGELLAVNAQHRRHSFIKNELTERLRRALRTVAFDGTALSEVSVALPPDSLPEPDIVVTSDPFGDGPVPVDTVALVVEIADTTLAFDLGRKARLYAAAGIPEYWVVEVAARIIHVFHEAADRAYAAKTTTAFGEPIAAATLPGVTIDTAGL